MGGYDMNEAYREGSELLKALADANRLLILDMLSGGELCGCMLLEGLSVTQPTLSHHMKILCEAGLIAGRKEGKWTHYSLNVEVAQGVVDYLAHILSGDVPCGEKFSFSEVICQ
jgi:ArsR family transcriptional regulator